MPVIQLRGTGFHTQVLGTGAPSMAMIHGLITGSIATWYFTAATGLAEDRQVLLYDLRGHGKTERVRSGYDLGTMTSDLAELLAWFQRGGDDARGDTMIEPIDLVGHSYGGLIALRYALEHPERVRRLAIVEAPLPVTRLEEVAQFADRSPDELCEHVKRGLPALTGHSARRTERLLDAIRFFAESSLPRDLRAERDIPDDVLGRVACPTLCVYGDRSDCRSVGDRLSQAIPNSKLVVLPGSHYIHLDATEALTTTLVDFFQP